MQVYHFLMCVFLTFSISHAIHHHGMIKAYNHDSQPVANGLAYAKLSSLLLVAPPLLAPLSRAATAMYALESAVADSAVADSAVADSAVAEM